jgi:hypothetical protein
MHAPRHSLIRETQLLAGTSTWLQVMAAIQPGASRAGARVGVGWSRAEVGMVVAQIGLGFGIIEPGPYSAIVLTSIATTLIAPPLIHLTFRGSSLPRGRTRGSSAWRAASYCAGELTGLSSRTALLGGPQHKDCPHCQRPTLCARLCAGSRSSVTGVAGSVACNRGDDPGRGDQADA